MATTSASPIRVGHCTRARRAFLVQVRQIEAGLPDKVVHLAVQMAAARDATPGRHEPALPAFDAWLSRKSMLDKAEIAIWLEDPPHFTQGGEDRFKRSPFPVR